jgi:hypothetical protein
MPTKTKTPKTAQPFQPVTHGEFLEYEDKFKRLIRQPGSGGPTSLDAYRKLQALDFWTTHEPTEEGEKEIGKLRRRLDNIFTEAGIK